jgi:CRISPR-associated protein Cmr2
MKSQTYWQDKISVWLHDPVCKVFDIKQHEQLAKNIADILFQSEPSKDQYQTADMIASALVRAAVPGYNADPVQDGSIDFAKSPLITHPLVNDTLPLKLPSVEVKKLVEDIKLLLKNDTDAYNKALHLKPNADREKALEQWEGWAQALFNYLFFAFQKRLRIENTGGLGALWDILPADTRVPDHPLWHHLGLTSALYSSTASDANHDVALVVFSITPVQEFIGNARKLRDFWASSVLLSYLAFTGLRQVMEKYGADHVLYPSLHNQPLVNVYLDQRFHLGTYLKEEDEVLQELNDASGSIAAFPNKFVFICPKDAAADFCKNIEKSINEEWIRQADFVKDFIAKKTGAKFDGLWKNQIDSYWKYSWSAIKIISLGDKETVAELLSKDKWEKEFETISAFAKAYGERGAQTARLYGASHSLVQGVLAAGKQKPSKLKDTQEGEKCPLCGEHEVLHDFENAGNSSAKKYDEAVKKFWGILRDETNADGGFSQTGKNERLCAVCAVKRYLPVAIKQYKTEILYNALNDSKFPSTTEIAAKDFIEELTKKIPVTSDEYTELIDILHNQELEASISDEDDSGAQKLLKEANNHGISYTNKDKYYALLLMDGDKMGDLVNGETIEAVWQDILHPDLVKQFENSQFAPNSPLRKTIKIDDKSMQIKDTKRTMNPALHAMISDSLNNFARYGVNPAVARGNGRLIYAGGDDVCAILPVSTAIETAKAIREAYTLSFAQYGKDGAQAITEGSVDLKKIGLHLGSSKKDDTKISISGAIIIAHHKQPLREVINNAHDALDKKAKEEAGRNALAIRLSKRSGGDRDVRFKWNDKGLGAFQTIINSELSTSLLYRIGAMKTLLEPLLGPYNEEKIIALFKYEVKHSGDNVKIADEEVEKLAKALMEICITKDNTEKWVFNPESAIIAGFLASGRQ